MARGNDEKLLVTKALTELFPSAFMDGKVLRIPIDLGAGEVQIKVQLTCAKDNLPHQEAVSTAPTKEEIEAVRELLQALGLPSNL